MYRTIRDLSCRLGIERSGSISKRTAIYTAVILSMLTAQTLMAQSEQDVINAINRYNYNVEDSSSGWINQRSSQNRNSEDRQSYGNNNYSHNTVRGKTKPMAQWTAADFNNIDFRHFQDGFSQDQSMSSVPSSMEERTDEHYQYDKSSYSQLWGYISGAVTITQGSSFSLALNIISGNYDRSNPVFEKNFNDSSYEELEKVKPMIFDFLQTAESGKSEEALKKVRETMKQCEKYPNNLRIAKALYYALIHLEIITKKNTQPVTSENSEVDTLKILQSNRDYVFSQETLLFTLAEFFRPFLKPTVISENSLFSFYLHHFYLSHIQYLLDFNENHDEINKYKDIYKNNKSELKTYSQLLFANETGNSSFVNQCRLLTLKLHNNLSIHNGLGSYSEEELQQFYGLTAAINYRNGFYDESEKYITLFQRLKPKSVSLQRERFSQTLPTLPSGLDQSDLEGITKENEDRINSNLSEITLMNAVRLARGDDDHWDQKYREYMKSLTDRFRSTVIDEFDRKLSSSEYEELLVSHFHSYPLTAIQGFIDRFIKNKQYDEAAKITNYWINLHLKYLKDQIRINSISETQEQTRPIRTKTGLDKTGGDEFSAIICKAVHSNNVSRGFYAYGVKDSVLKIAVLKLLSAESLITQEKYSEATPILNEIIPFGEKVGLFSTELQFDQSNFNSSSGNYITALVPALTISEKVRIMSSISEYYYGINDPDKGKEWADRALAAALTHRSDAAAGVEERSAMFASYYYLYERKLTHLVESGNTAEAYQTMEEARSAGLNELMLSSKIDLYEGLDPKEVQRLKTNLSLAEGALNQARSNTRLNQKIDPRMQAMGQQFGNLTVQLTEEDAQKLVVEAKRQIEVASPVYRRILESQRNFAQWDEIQSALKQEETTAIQYLIGNESSYLLVYGTVPEEPTFYRLSLSKEQADYIKSTLNIEIEPGELTAKTLNTIFYGEDGVLNLMASDESPETLTSILQALWGILIPDETFRQTLLDGRSCRKLLVLADGGLSDLPFETLVTGQTAEGEPVYLLDSGPTVYYAPSASLWYQLKNKSTSDVSSVLTAGNPTYPQEEVSEDQEEEIIEEVYVTTRSVVKKRGLQHLDPLPGTAEETESIADYCKKFDLPCIRYDGSETTEKNIRENGPGKSLIHLACHGLIDNNHGNMFSALALTPGQPDDSKDDGFLTVGEMYEMDLSSCEMMILSACETNLGTKQPGEGTWSLGRGALVSGVKRTTVSNWSIEDESASELISRYVADFLKNGRSDKKDYAQSLRRAKQSLRSDPDHPEWSRPCCWAPFIMIGTN